MAHQMSRSFIKKLARAQTYADHQRTPITFNYKRHSDEDGRLLEQGAFVFSPGPELIGDNWIQTGLLDEISEQILEKYKSAINGQISHMKSVIQLEKTIAKEIVEIYREKLKAPDPKDVTRLKRLLAKDR